VLEVYGSGYINEVSETRKRGKRRHGISKGDRRIDFEWSSEI
jgi:hypothetical protein